jgi:hypothetical protein
MPKLRKAKLFQMEVNLLDNGNVEMLLESADPEEVLRIVDSQLPDYDGGHNLASLLRYLKRTGDDILERSGQFVH